MTTFMKVLICIVFGALTLCLLPIVILVFIAGGGILTGIVALIVFGLVIYELGCLFFGKDDSVFTILDEIDNMDD